MLYRIMTIVIFTICCMDVQLHASLKVYKEDKSGHLTDKFTPYEKGLVKDTVMRSAHEVLTILESQDSDTDWRVFVDPTELRPISYQHASTNTEKMSQAPSAKAADSQEVVSIYIRSANSDLESNNSESEVDMPSTRSTIAPVGNNVSQEGEKTKHHEDKPKETTCCGWFGF